ncbi:MAG TPA: hypothetical protein VFK43_02410 [Acidimicrobiales bacterium]|nr:hypothetical protein [Acidimicrobiales bacterium]
MVAFITSIIVLVVGTALVMLVGSRRPVGTPLTWAEAMLGAVAVFALFVLAYGIVPNQWLLWADNELKWRADAIGIPSPFGTLFEDGITFFGRGRVLVTKQAIRDIVATVIYVVMLGANIWLWSVWQKRGQRKDTPAIETSTFGRPLVRKA